MQAVYFVWCNTPLAATVCRWSLLHCAYFRVKRTHAHCCSKHNCPVSLSSYWLHVSKFLKIMSPSLSYTWSQKHKKNTHDHNYIITIPCTRYRHFLQTYACPKGNCAFLIIIHVHSTCIIIDKFTTSFLSAF